MKSEHEKNLPEPVPLITYQGQSVYTESALKSYGDKRVADELAKRRNPVAWMAASGWTTTSIGMANHHKEKGVILTPLYK